MYAGLAHLDEEVLRLNGCLSRHDFQETLLTRAKLLHDLKSEPDIYTVAQATLLMSINHESSRTSTIWLAHSHLAAQKLGLENRGAYLLMKIDQSNLSKRLWWSIYVRDNTLRLELGSPLRLQEVPYHVPLLNLDCFNLSPFSTLVQSRLPEAPYLQKPEIHEMLMQIAIQRSGLVCQLSQILAMPARMSVSSKVQQDESVYFDQALREWDWELEPDLRFEPKSSRVFEYHCGLLSLLYLSTSNALHLIRLQPRSGAIGLDRIRTDVEHNTGQALNTASALYLSGSLIPPTMGMGMVYNAVNLSVTLAKWRKLSLVESLPLDSAIICLRALVESQPRGTAMEIALCHLGSRMQSLLIESEAKVEDIKQRGRHKGADSFDNQRGIDVEEKMSSLVASKRAK
ncbi:hypothetical protein LTR10_024206 [Elasticomyces elasticus]|uniref:Xylanolytic transcriptional activator regulatory domain-containing protein n=1 Tax=Exophiala sideris TaxID=1016849 RepID=A0ABR0IW68_9EURO|nr:hypothetical protein LTR10_024206 [Elasticomyces elasticus]KAK5022853.1 hypothetical protein LTR13_011394 [Exophiala sideris]KAK5048796.1 hypothetical protein LTR69_011259 [Exophiala sideris]